jgi:hypothetical protein
MTIEDLSGTHRKSAEVVALIDGIEDRSNYWIQVDPATFEQFIGLTDKYSKKIIFYERAMLL